MKKNATRWAMLLFSLALPMLAQAQIPKKNMGKLKSSKIEAETNHGKGKMAERAVEAAPAPKEAAVKQEKGVPKMTFETRFTDFGTIKKGDKPAFTYHFTNTGDSPLDIEIVSACDCTELEYSTKTVAPGEKGFIKATYNSNKTEHDEFGKLLKKDITIVLKQSHAENGYPIVEELKFNVLVSN